jgi:hypothetical protein
VLKRIPPGHFLVCVAMLCLAQTLLAGQSLRCRAHDFPARLRPNDPVYADAMDLARTLNERGFVVNCVCASLMQRRFESQKGAAHYVTDQGVFETLFLPKPRTFAALEISEARKGVGYLYSFRESGLDLSSVEDSSKPIDFIKHGNQLFEVWGNKRLAAKLHEAFDLH